MIKGRTTSGFEFEVDERLANDARFFDILAEAEENPVLAPKITLTFLGKEQRDRLYKHLEKDGIVPMDKVEAEMEEMFKLAGEASEGIKNS